MAYDNAETAIRVDGLSKCYQIYDRPHQRLLQMLYHGHRRYYREFWALKDVSFAVRRGETVGIIGKNGSGKSTLLQMICGTLAPTAGRIETSGRIAALLELGAGFNPEFTGRENVYMNGAVLGFTHEEMDERFEAIAAFADIGEFIEQPVKSYSSGMYVRLAFAVQAMVNPDILVVDEALAVGDAKFQAKCFERLRRLKEGGTSILLVTHAGEQVVTHCDRAVLLDAGAIVEQGEPRRVVNRYMDLLFGKERKERLENKEPESAPEAAPDDAPAEDGPSAHDDLFHTRPGYNPHEYRWGDGSALILDYRLAADGEPWPTGVETGRTLTLSVSVRFLETLVRPILGITIKSKEGVTVYGVNTETLDAQDFAACGAAGTGVAATARFPCRLAPGDYFISLGVATREGDEIIPRDRRYDAIHLQVRPNPAFFGLVDLQLRLAAKPLP